MDASEIERAHAGGPRERRALAQRLWPIVQLAVARRLLPIARAQGRDAYQDRDDFVSAVFLSLFEHDWRALRSFDPARGSLEAYIATIAGRHVLGAFRVKSRDPYAEIPLEDEAIDNRRGVDDGLEDRAVAREDLDGLYRYLLDRLDERGLLLFHMLIVEELPVPSICEGTGMSRDAVYQWRVRFKSIVRQWQRQRAGEP
ncbi:MAG TPA: sigma-70 family RNA polymerase sigma factor [Enhygromyxa sp.]|nr:sigma-70 family RNA polymerase sigma factor [Enhygromyxa sp.]